MSLFCYALLCGHSSFAIILKRKRKLVALLLHVLSCRCIVTINVLWLFLTVPSVGLQCMIVVFPDHITYFLLVFEAGRMRFLRSQDTLSLFLHDILTCMHISKDYNENRDGRLILTIKNARKTYIPLTSLGLKRSILLIQSISLMLWGTVNRYCDISHLRKISLFT